MRGSLWGGMMVLVLVVMGAVWEAPMASGELSESQCKEERKSLTEACRALLFGQNPSPDCCQRIRVTHAECVCPYVTAKVAAHFSEERRQRTIKQVEGCGRTVPHNYKCCSVTTP